MTIIYREWLWMTGTYLIYFFGILISSRDGEDNLISDISKAIIISLFVSFLPVCISFLMCLIASAIFSDFNTRLCLFIATNLTYIILYLKNRRFRQYIDELHSID